MIAFLALCYSAFIWLVFYKLKLLPFNRGAKICVVTIGLVAILGLIVAMNLCQPYSTNATITAFTTPIVPRVTGRVIEVSVKANEPLQKGDVLFKIDPTPYQAQVDRLTATLAEAEQVVPQLKAAYDTTTAAVERSKVQRDLAKVEFDRERDLKERGMAAALEYERARAEFARSETAVREAEARQEQARLAYNSKFRGENTTVARVRAGLAAAQLDLRECTVYAPADGYVTHFFLKPGAIATSQSVSPVMTFVYSGEPIVTSTFSANVQRHMKVDDSAEITLDTHPGRTLKARVLDIVPAVGEGALSPSGTLLRSTEVPQKGRIVVLFKFDENISDMRVQVGTGGAVAIYTDRGNAISIIRRVIIRMYAWLNYLPAH